MLPAAVLPTPSLRTSSSRHFGPAVLLERSLGAFFKQHLEGLGSEALEVHDRLFVVRILQGKGGSEVLARFFPFKK